MKNLGIYNCLIIILLTMFPGCSREQEKTFEPDPAELVNPLMGTDSEFKLSSGNTYPAIALPWGMNFWTPQTKNMNDGWIYAYDDHKIQGIKQTHQPSPWINDYASFSLMAYTGRIRFKGELRARDPSFNHFYEFSCGKGRSDPCDIVDPGQDFSRFSIRKRGEGPCGILVIEGRASCLRFALKHIGQPFDRVFDGPGVVYGHMGRPGAGTHDGRQPNSSKIEAEFAVIKPP